MTIIVHFTIEHQVHYDWKFKEQHAKMWENIAGAKRYSVLSPPWFQRCGGEHPRRPLHSDAFAGKRGIYLLIAYSSITQPFLGGF